MQTMIKCKSITVILIVLVFIFYIIIQFVNSQCLSDLGCGSGCSQKCPFGFPCRVGTDCLSGSCTGFFCDIGRPASFNGKPAPVDGPPANQGPTGSSWSTVASIGSLADFGKLMKDSYGASNRAFVSDPAGGSGKVLRVFYPKGSFKPANQANVGGTGFYATPIDLSKATTVTLEYKLFFEIGFDFVKGGKLPGLFGGHPSCSGGNAAKDCFSTRFMFRAGGAGELYTYLDQGKQLPGFCKVPPLTICNPAYGVSVGRGAYNFKPGEWTTMSQTIKLNTAGQTNGAFSVSCNGKQVMSYNEVSWRNMASVGFIGLDFETFFGGSDATWATPKDQYVFFKDFKLIIG